MHRRLAEEETADRVLDGKIAAEDAPHGLEGVAALITAVHLRIAASTVAPDPGVVAAMAGVLTAPSMHSAPPHVTRRRTMLTKLITTKAAAVAVVTVLGATGAAAAAGGLPGPAQRTVSTALSNVGISVPGRVSDVSAPAGPNAGPGHSDFGHCTALFGHDFDASTTTTAVTSPSTTSPPTTSPKDESTAFADFIKAHGGTLPAAAAYCRTVAHPGHVHVHGHAPATGTAEPGDVADGTGPGDSHHSAKSGAAKSGSAKSGAAKVGTDDKSEPAESEVNGAGDTHLPVANGVSTTTEAPETTEAPGASSPGVTGSGSGHSGSETHSGSAGG